MKQDSDSLFRECVAIGADPAAVAAWPDSKRRRFIDDTPHIKITSPELAAAFQESQGLLEDDRAAAPAWYIRLMWLEAFGFCPSHEKAPVEHPPGPDAASRES